MIDTVFAPDDGWQQTAELARTSPATDAGRLPPRTPPGTLQRLSHLPAQAELGQTYQQTQAAFGETLLAACEDAGPNVPQGANIDLDFTTGHVAVTRPKQTQEVPDAK